MKKRLNSIENVFKILEKASDFLSKPSFLGKCLQKASLSLKKASHL
jgi:hypothetical protein